MAGKTFNCRQELLPWSGTTLLCRLGWSVSGTKVDCSPNAVLRPCSPNLKSSAKGAPDSVQRSSAARSLTSCRGRCFLLICVAGCTGPGSKACPEE